MVRISISIYSVSEEHSMRKDLAFFVLLATLTGAVSMCSAAEVGMILTGKVLGFWQGVTKGAQRAAADMHVDLMIRSPADGAALDTQTNIQLKLIDYMVQRGVTGIVLAPEPLVGVATPYAIPLPTVLIDRDSTDYTAISTVETDNFAAGRTAAFSLVPVLNKGAKVAVLRLAANISSTTERENGFISVAREMGWNVVIDSYVGYRFRESQALTYKALNGYDGHLDAVFAPAETVAYGAVRVVESMPTSARPKLVAVDWRPEFLSALKRGTLYAAVVQDPYRMGYLAVKTLVAATQGHPPPPLKQYVGVMTVTQSNINDPATQAAIANYGD
jgi:ribose transport system substrate-binding protein